ncbi:hypothetical protein ACS0TY_034131 [Phlomoides rotata]
MAAYAALISLRHIIDQIEHHPRPPISLEIQQVESLIEKVTAPMLDTTVTQMPWRCALQTQLMRLKT